MALERKSDGISVGGLFGARKDDYIGKRSQHIVFIPWDTTEGAEWTTKTNNWNLARTNKFTIVHHQSGHTSTDIQGLGADPGAVIYIRGHGNPGFPYIMANHTPPDHQAVLGLVLPIVDACQRLIDAGLSTAFSGAIKFYSCHSGTKPTSGEMARFQSKWQSEQRNFGQLQQINEDKLRRIKQGEQVMDPNKKNSEGKWGVPFSQRDIEVQLEISAETLKKGVAQDKSLARQGADYMRAKGYKHCVYYGYLGPLGSTYELDTDSDPLKVHKVVELDGLMSRPKALEGLSTVRPQVARVRV